MDTTRILVICLVFRNISFKPWLSVLMIEENPCIHRNHKPIASNLPTFKILSCIKYPATHTISLLLRFCDCTVLLSSKHWKILRNGLSIFIMNTTNQFKMTVIYIETSLNRTSMVLAFVFGIDKCLVYTDLINKDFLHWDFF